MTQRRGAMWSMPVTLDASHSLHIHSTVTFRSMLWHWPGVWLPLSVWLSMPLLPYRWSSWLSNLMPSWVPTSTRHLEEAERSVLKCEKVTPACLLLCSMILHCTLGTLRHILAVNLPNTILIAYSTVGSSRVGRTIPDMYDLSCHITSHKVPWKIINI